MRLEKLEPLKNILRGGINIKVDSICRGCQLSWERPRFKRFNGWGLCVLNAGKKR